MTWLGFVANRRKSVHIFYFDKEMSCVIEVNEFFFFLNHYLCQTFLVLANAFLMLFFLRVLSRVYYIILY